VPDTASSGPTAASIVLLGDIHLSCRFAWPWQLLSKRLLGMLNLWLNRKRNFDASLLVALFDRIDSLDPDHLLWAGDLTTTAMPAEFAMVRRLLLPVMNRHPGLAVPGNHDRYTFTSVRQGYFEMALGDHTAHHWPMHRELHPGVHLISLDPTRANLIGDQAEVGPRQLGELKTTLASIPAGDRVLLLCHYTLGPPPGMHERASHRMTDEAELARTLATAGRTIYYIHGHTHQPWCFRHAAAPNVVCLNCGSPTLRTRDHPRGQGFWRLTLGPDPSLERHTVDASGRWRVVDVPIPHEPGQTAAVPLA
jgi:calcineurin-like phosphoesterase family protein